MGSRRLLAAGELVERMKWASGWDKMLHRAEKVMQEGQFNDIGVLR